MGKLLPKVPGGAEVTSATYTPVSQQHPGARPREHADFAWVPADSDEAKRIVAIH